MSQNFCTLSTNVDTKLFFLGGTLFNRHRITIERGELNTDFSKVYYFLLSITHRSEETNQYMNCVNIHPFDIDEKEFGDDFKPKRLDFIRDKKSETVQSVCNVLKKLFKFPIPI